jgi:hypothetical protein
MVKVCFRMAGRRFILPGETEAGGVAHRFAPDQGLGGLVGQHQTTAVPARLWHEKSLNAGGARAACGVARIRQNRLFAVVAIARRQSVTREHQRQPAAMPLVAEARRIEDAVRQRPAVLARDRRICRGVPARVLRSGKALPCRHGRSPAGWRDSGHRRARRDQCAVRRGADAADRDERRT